MMKNKESSVASFPPDAIRPAADLRIGQGSIPLCSRARAFPRCIGVSAAEDGRSLTLPSGMGPGVGACLPVITGDYRLKKLFLPPRMPATPKKEATGGTPVLRSRATTQISLPITPKKMFL